jgi:peptidoglycan/xylan/chitin deacetylase (PgdA/CDA1 family)
MYKPGLGRDMISSQKAKRRLTRLLGPLARDLTARRARVLMYHRFCGHDHCRRTSAATFEQQVAYLARNFRPRRLADVVARLRAREPLEDRTVVITVDDGYADFLEFAYPILTNYEVPATVYLVSEFTGQGHWLWFDAVEWLTQRAPAGAYALEMTGEVLEAELSAAESRVRLSRQLFDRCLKLPPAEIRATLKALQAQLNVKLPASPPPEHAAMSWDQVRSLDPALIDIGSHTRTHPLLALCEADEQIAEIEGSKVDIERQIGRKVEAFAYPNGQRGDFSAATTSIVRECGFSSAAIAYGGMVRADGNPFALSRLGAPVDMHLFRNCVNGLWELRASASGKEN